MSNHGFYITQVRLTGTEVAPAEIKLSDGFNVIFGASNTGKTYISQCIDFVFGRSDKPKNIPEARAYDTVHVVLHNRNNNDVIKLLRSLHGGEISVRINDEEVKTLNSTHSDRNSDNISSFLLKLCGLLGKRLTVNANGKTRSLSFRDLSHLAIINEEEIIKSNSPIHSRSYTDNTVRQSVFRLLISGIDDSSVVERKEAKIRKAEARGKGEILENIESDILKKISGVTSKESKDELEKRFLKLDNALKSISDSLRLEREAHSSVENDRKQIWTRLQQVESRQEVLVQLRERFYLLASQYKSDLERLDSIAEVGQRLEELNEERCPVCGALAENHSIEHSDRELSPEIISASAVAETQKVQLLLSGLSDTITETQEEAESLETERIDLEASLKEITQILQNEYQPRISAVLEHYQHVLDERVHVKEALDYHEQLERIDRLRADSETPPPLSDSTIITKVSSVLAEPFCLEVERLLEEWQLPEAGRVTFSEDSQDIVIAERERNVDGKGVRAITHAAFSLAINNYCVEQELPTSSLVILDSPLVVYRKPDEGEQNFSPDVKTNFYRQLALSSKNRQVIVLENDDPPKDLDDTVNVIHFTRSDHGRYGFIPLSTSGNGAGSDLDSA